MNKSNILFTPIKNKRTFEEVSFGIKKMIINGQLKPGDKLRSEIELANRFHVGRQSIREAHRILELSGFISIKKGFGGGPVIENAIFIRRVREHAKAGVRPFKNNADFHEFVDKSNEKPNIYRPYAIHHGHRGGYFLPNPT